MRSRDRQLALLAMALEVFRAAAFAGASASALAQLGDELLHAIAVGLERSGSDWIDVGLEDVPAAAVGLEAARAESDMPPIVGNVYPSRVAARRVACAQTAVSWDRGELSPIGLSGV